MRFFLEGKLARALGVLEKREADRSQEGTIPTASAGKERSEETSRDYQLKGQLLTLALQINDADTAHKAALTATPDDFDANITYASFLSSAKRGERPRRAPCAAWNWRRRAQPGPNRGSLASNGA